MLVPRITIRWLLLLMSGSSIVFYVVALGVQGKAWAIAVSLGVANLTVAFLCYAAFFAFAFLLAKTLRLVRAEPQPDTSPTISESLPQIIPSDEPE